MHSPECIKRSCLYCLLSHLIYDSILINLNFLLFNSYITWFPVLDFICLNVRSHYYLSKCDNLVRIYPSFPQYTFKSTYVYENRTINTKFKYSHAVAHLWPNCIKCNKLHSISLKGQYAKQVNISLDIRTGCRSSEALVVLKVKCYFNRT